jgi:anti-sigma B factor antagonist
MTYTLATDKGLLLLTLAGDLIGGFETEKLYRAVDEVIEGGAKRCVVDLSKVRFLNSTGIGLLITLLAKFRNRGGDLAIMRPPTSLKSCSSSPSSKPSFSRWSSPTKHSVNSSLNS